MGCLGKEPLLHGTGTFAQDSSTAADWVAIIMWYYSHLFNSVLSTNLERSIVISLDVGWSVRLRVWTPSADLSPRIGLKPIAQIDKCHLTIGGLMWIFQTLCRSLVDWRAFISGFPMAIGYWHFLNKKKYRICNQKGPRGGIKVGVQHESCSDHYSEQLSRWTLTLTPPLGPPIGIGDLLGPSGTS